VLPFPVEFLIFALTLFAIALFHRQALLCSVGGLVAAIVYKGLATSGGTQYLAVHFGEEWVLLANLLLLLLGFAVLSNQFERSKLPDAIPAWLPGGRPGGLALLAFVFVLSIFLDNIAAAVIGGIVARHVFRNRVRLGFLAAIVASANAGGSGSVIGDTTTTMMWIGGVSASEVAPAFIGAITAFAFFGVVAAGQQQRFQPIDEDPAAGTVIDWARVAIVLILLLAVLGANLAANNYFPQLEASVPALGLGLWAAILATSFFRQPNWAVLKEAATGAIFLVALVALASLMPVEHLPAPSPATVLGLGFLSAVFDNIPLTALALEQGGYNWALLAYAVGFGGSMVWFGSSAGVALTTLFPQGRSVFGWVREGWHIPVAYVLGFVAMLIARNI
jgi:Na+/H+ antiporter NhaD/arsenite permease-like protein